MGVNTGIFLVSPEIQYGKLRGKCFYGHTVAIKCKSGSGT
jgi:hypothetical protein